MNNSTMNPLFSAMPESIFSTVFQSNLPNGDGMTMMAAGFPHLVPSASSSPSASAESSPATAPKTVVSSSTITTSKSKKSSKSSDNGGKRKRTPKAADAPRRPLSAYNLFFKRERTLILASLNEDNNNNNKAESPSPESSDTESSTSHKKDQEPVFVGGSYSGMLSTPQGQTVVQPVDGPRPRRLKRSHRRTHGKISFADMAKRISAKWKSLDDETRRPFVEQAKVEKAQYVREVAKYKARKAQEAKEEVQPTTMMSAGEDSSEIKTSTAAATVKINEVEDGPETKKAKVSTTKEETIESKSTMPKRPSSLDAVNDQVEGFLCNVEPSAVSVSPGTSDSEEVEEEIADPFDVEIEEVDASDLLGILDTAVDLESGDMTNTTTSSMPPKKAIAHRRSSLLMMMGDEEANNNNKPPFTTPKVATSDATDTSLPISMPSISGMQMPTIPPGVDTLRFMEGYLHQQQLQIARNNDILRKARMAATMVKANNNNNGGEQQQIGSNNAVTPI